MRTSRIVAFALAGAMVIAGCVSIETLDRDLKSVDPVKQSAAQQNLAKIITDGRVDFSKFNTQDRLWCAKHLTDKAEIVRVIEAMSHRYYGSSTSQEECDARMGMYDDINAPILEALLGTLGPNKEVFEIFASGEFAVKVHEIAFKYVESCVEGINDIDTLNVMKEKYWNWRNMGMGQSGIPQALSERIIPTRFLALISTTKDVKAFLNDNMLCNWSDNKLAKLAIAKISNQKELSVLVAECPDWSSEIIECITDADILAEIAVNEKDASWQYRGRSAGEKALKKITNKAVLVRIALLAKNEVVSRQAKAKVGDNKAIVDGLVELLNSKKISEKDAESHIENLDGGMATIALYNAVQGRLIKQKTFEKLCEADRKIVRAGNVAKCKQMIEAAKAKSSETFEMGGFYLGMDISDVEPLVGYYFPEWTTSEKVDDDENDIRVVYVPQQRRPFCRADKTGKVWQFNFGKNFLKKFFKYDVQDEREWARAYSKEHGIDMKHVFLNKDTTVADVSGSLNVTTYKAWLNQNTWQWKDNAKGYRLVYFAEPKIETAHGNIVKQQALYQFRFISSDAGTLRATVEND